MFWRCVDLISIALLISLGLSLKEAPVTASRVLLPNLTALVIIPNLLYEGFKGYCWAADRHEPPPPKIFRSVAVHMLSIVAALSITWKPHTPTSDGDGDEIAWALLSIAIFNEFSLFITVAFIPNQRFGMFGQVIERLLMLDVPVFLSFFFVYLMCFWASMYMNYPRAGVGRLDIVPEFNNLFDSFEAMLNLVMTGRQFTIDFHSASVMNIDNTDEYHLYGSHSKFINLVIFTLFYYYLMLLLVMLLLRLLMAMLSATFNEVKKDATLEWRRQFARYVLELESFYQRLGGETNAGEKIGDRWIWSFREQAAEASEVADPRTASISPMASPKGSFNTTIAAGAEELTAAEATSPKSPMPPLAARPGGRKGLTAILTAVPSNRSAPMSERSRQQPTSERSRQQSPHGPSA